MSKGIVLAALLALPFASPAVTFRVVDLGSYWWTNESTGLAINNAGKVVGQSHPGGGMAFAWTVGGGMRLPGLMQAGFTTSCGEAVSDAGYVAGYSWYLPQLNAPCVWFPNGRFQRIPFPSQTVFGEATGVNSAGEVVGWARGNHPGKAWLWSPTLGLIEMGEFTQGKQSEALGVNEHGQAVGFSSIPFEDTIIARAFFWSFETGIVDLGVLPGYRVSIADSINDFGVACGVCYETSLPDQACLFSTSAPPISLGRIQGWPTSATTAQDLNNTGQVVGNAYDALKVVGFYYSPELGIKDVNDLLDAESKAAGWVVGNCQSINDHIQITGIARRNGLRRAVLLVPTD